MHRSILGLSTGLVLGLLALSTAALPARTWAEDEAYDMATGDPDYEAMPNAPGKNEVFAFCSACHSMKLVAQQHLSRARWNHLLDWMVEEQGMAPLPDEERKIVLDYLAIHYGPRAEEEPPGP